MKTQIGMEGRHWGWWVVQGCKEMLMMFDFYVGGAGPGQGRRLGQRPKRPKVTNGKISPPTGGKDSHHKKLSCR